VRWAIQKGHRARRRFICVLICKDCLDRKVHGERRGWSGFCQQLSACRKSSFHGLAKLLERARHGERTLKGFTDASIAAAVITTSKQVRRTPLNFLAAFFLAAGFFTDMNSPDVLLRLVQAEWLT
jgi:predicted NAD/FAD-binding protein